jgi:hypothetical protein
LLATPKTLPGILEKQNRLQMSQVLFHCPRINQQVVLLFKDSKSGTGEPGGARFSNDLKKQAQLKNKHSMLTISGDSLLNKNSVPPLARPLSQPMPRQARPTYPLHLVGLRCGLAS